MILLAILFDIQAAQRIAWGCPPNNGGQRLRRLLVGVVCQKWCIIRKESRDPAAAAEPNRWAATTRKMKMFNPSEHRTQCEKDISRFLESQVDFIRAELMTKSTREAPWRLDVRVNGVPQSYVLQLDPKDMEYEYRILKAVESIPVSTPHVYGLDLQGEALGVACFFSDFYRR